MIGIYQILNKIDNRCYIGQSIHLEIRKEEHFSELRRNIHKNKYLQNAFNKYGENNFQFNILEECSKDDLSSKEIFWIDYYGGYESSKTYNLTPGGYSLFGKANPCYGRIWTEEERQKQSERLKEVFKDPTKCSMYGKKHSEATKDKIRKTLSNRKQTEESNIKRSNTFYRYYYIEHHDGHFKGKHHSEETKDKLRQSSSQYRHSEETRKKISQNLKGANNPMYGKHHSEESRKRLSETHIGENNNMYGKHHTDESKQKMSESKIMNAMKKFIHIDSKYYYFNLCNINSIQLNHLPSTVYEGLKRLSEDYQSYIVISFSPNRRTFVFNILEVEKRLNSGHKSLTLTMQSRWNISYEEIGYISSKNDLNQYLLENKL